MTTTTAESEPLTRSDDFLHAIAHAYSDSVLTGADMGEATTALEVIRHSFEAGDDFETWAAVDNCIGVVTDSPLEGVLNRFRERFAARLMDLQIARLRDAFAADARAGWVSWLRTCGKALGKRPEFCAKLSLVEFPFPPDVAETVATVQRGARYVNQVRWDEAYELHALLAAEPCVDVADRVELCVTAAEIQLFFLYREQAAEELLKAAEQLAAGLAKPKARVLTAWAAWHLERRKIEETRKTCAASMEIDPQDCRAYLIMGDTYERENDLTSAEEWYREARKRTPGDFSVHLRFVALYARPDFANGDREQLIAESIRRAVAVNPETEYWTYVSVGDIYQTTKAYDQASAWYDKAMALDPTGLRAYIAAGYLAIEQSALDRARALFQKAIESAPGAFDGYWAMAYLNERFDNDDAGALAFYELALERRPVWEGIVRARIGAVLRRMGKLADAEHMLLRAVAADPGSAVDAIATLEEIAVAAGKGGDTDAAMRVFTAIRDAAGPPYEADYQNRLGNLRAEAREFEAAAAHYEDAIAANPSNPVLYGNAALAYVELPGNRAENFGKAVAALTKALALAPDHQDYRSLMGDYRFRLGMAAHAGDAALDIARPEPVVVRFALNLLPYVTQSADDLSLSAALKELVEKVRAALLTRTGARIPAISFSDITDDAAPAGSYQLEVFGRQIATGSVQSDGEPARFSPGDERELERVKIKGKRAADPLTGERGWWVRAEDWPRADAAGLALWHVMEYPLRHLEAVCFELIGGDAAR